MNTSPTAACTLSVAAVLFLSGPLAAGQAPALVKAGRVPEGPL